MLGRGSFRQSATRRALGRALATTAVLSQLFALIVAPLGDLGHQGHQVDQFAAPASSALVVAAASAVDAPGVPLPHHDAATCPACIAQSIVAHTPSTVASVFVASTLEHLDPLERVLAPRPGPSSLHRSRGPPLRS